MTLIFSLMSKDCNWELPKTETGSMTSSYHPGPSRPEISSRKTARHSNQTFVLGCYPVGWILSLAANHVVRGPLKRTISFIPMPTSDRRTWPECRPKKNVFKPNCKRPSLGLFPIRSFRNRILRKLTLGMMNASCCI